MDNTIRPFRVFIGVVSSEQQNVATIKSIFELIKEPNDGLWLEFRTRGDVARESMVEQFIKEKEYDALLMLDADQVHPKSLLEKLRKSMLDNDLDMVCAHYYRRETQIIQSLCYELTEDGTYPYFPLLNIPETGLHEIAITGLGCVLIHRRVIEAVQKVIPEGDSPFAIGVLPGESNDYANWGSDFRFFTLARRLGFRLWLDADVESLHAVTLFLGHKSAKKLMNYTKWADAHHDLFLERLKIHGMSLEALRQRRRILEARLQGFLNEAEPLKGKEESRERLTQLSLMIYEMDGRLKENGAMMEWEEQYPKIIRGDQLPTTENTPKQNHSEGMSEEQLKEEREGMYRRNAMDLIDMLPLKGNGRR